MLVSETSQLKAANESYKLNAEQILDENREFKQRFKQKLDDECKELERESRSFKDIFEKKMQERKALYNSLKSASLLLSI